MFSMDYKDISERISLLTKEIRDLQRMDTALHCYGSQRISRASRRKERELRLSQIREELSKMMVKPTREQ
jgi:iron-sulfur cluster repair protein YtfE (RIC family)